MGLLKTLAIIVIVYYVFNFIGRYIVPLFLRSVVKKAEKKFNQQQQQQRQQQQAEDVKIGETIIDKRPSNQKESNKDVGDYVDYEEIND